MIEVLDSHYNYVRTRVLAANASRLFKGAMKAQDWPEQNVHFEAFYMLDLGAPKPLGRQTYSASDQIFSYTVQWTWIVMGSDITTNTKGRNRADRYRTDYAMMEELRSGLFPNFCEKVQVSLDTDGIVQKTSYSPKEYIHWTPAEFNTRTDKESGLIYSMCTVRITGIAANIAE